MADDFLSKPVVKRSVRVAGHMTSVSLEEPFWGALRTIAAQEKRSLNTLIADIDSRRGTNLSSALRLYVLERLSKA